jgi:ABC-2 type transport system ATP-binding protein
MVENVIELHNLSRRFGSKNALKDVSLSVPRGTVFGLVGENGAGKSTLIKHILGLWRAEAGQVRVFGLDPVSNPVAVLGRIGYLSEQPDLPEWMRVYEYMRYLQAFYPKWDVPYAESLRDQFAIDRNAQVRVLSKGQRAKLGLLAAQAHRPDLLLLDEPSSGLDPIVRNDILTAVIRTVADEGRTVFFSSHLLEEIERVSDHVAMLHQGKLVLYGPLDAIKAQHRRITLALKHRSRRRPSFPAL